MKIFTTAALTLAAITTAGAASAALISVDPDGDGTDGGMIAANVGGRVNNTTSTAATGSVDVNTFVDTAITGGVLYIGFNMATDGTDGYYYAFESADGVLSGDRNINFGHENGDTNITMYVNDKTGEPTVSAETALGVGVQQHDYIIRIDFNAGNNDDVFTLYVDPTTDIEGSNATEISGLTGSDLTGITRVGFASFASEPAIGYSNVHLATSFDEVANALGVPEPGSLALLGLGGLLIARRRRA